MAMQQLGHLELSYPSCSMEGGHTYSKAFFIGGFVSNSINEKYVSEEAAGVKGVKELAQGREVEQGTESYAKEHHGQYDTLSPHTVRGKRVSAQWHPWAVQIHVKDVQVKNGIEVPPRGGEGGACVRGKTAGPRA